MDSSFRFWACLVGWSLITAWALTLYIDYRIQQATKASVPKKDRLVTVGGFEADLLKSPVMNDIAGFSTFGLGCGLLCCVLLMFKK